MEAWERAGELGRCAPRLVHNPSAGAQLSHTTSSLKVRKMTRSLIPTSDGEVRQVTP